MLDIADKYLKVTIINVSDNSYFERTTGKKEHVLRNKEKYDNFPSNRGCQ